MSQCGQDINVELEDVIADPLPTLPTIPPSTGTGPVVGIDDWPTTGLIDVLPGGSGIPISVPTLSNYTPQVGDLAYLIKQGSQWIALGSLSTRNIGGSLPVDGISNDGAQGRWSFENGANLATIGGGWTLINDSAGSVSVIDARYAVVSPTGVFGLAAQFTPIPHGNAAAVLEFVVPSDGEDLVYTMLSPAISCAPNQQWQIGCSARYTSLFGLQEGAVGLRFLWNSSGIQVGGVAASFTGSSAWVPIQSQPITVPAGNSSFQIAIGFSSQTSLVGSAAASGRYAVDNVQARRVS